MSLYISAFIFLSILASLPVPAAEKHPRSMMLTPPCFTVGMVLAQTCRILIWQTTLTASTAGWKSSHSHLSLTCPYLTLTQKLPIHQPIFSPQTAYLDLRFLRKIGSFSIRRPGELQDLTMSDPHALELVLTNWTISSHRVFKSLELCEASSCFKSSTISPGPQETCHHEVK
ncbi:hypothetical protein ILYODFUR_038875 [Ilyodon furcidens]|uniref:Uncharacterized protein n=1 Tax=Ilyodon furcidens TaxID=33524 RepID=A0ABV0UF02_9TELE